MSLPTNYQDDLLDTSQNTTRIYDLVNASGSVVQSNVHLVDKTVYTQKGTELSANDINNANNVVNTVTFALDGYKIRAVTRAEYDALPTPRDSTTFYFILASD